MNKDDYEAIIEDSQEIKGSSNSDNTPTQLDYANVLAQMKEELEKIPSQFPGGKKRKSSDDDSSEREELKNKSGKFTLKQQGSDDISNEKENTDNMPYTYSLHKKNTESKDEYEEDFENDEYQSSENSSMRKSKNLEVPLKKEIKIEQTGNDSSKGINSINKDNIKKQSTKPPSSSKEVGNIKTNIKVSEERKEIKKSNSLNRTSDKVNNLPATTNKSNQVPAKQATKSVERKPIVIEKGDENKLISSSHEKASNKPKDNKEAFRIRPSSAVTSSSTKKIPSQDSVIKIQNRKNIEPKNEGIEEDIEIDEEIPKSYYKLKDKKASTQPNFRIKSAKPSNHKDMLRQIFNEFKEKEKKAQEKDEKIFALEEAEKRIKPKKNEEDDILNLLENNWLGNGLGKKSTLDPIAKDKPPLKKSNITRTLAAHFLANIEKKIGKKSEHPQTSGKEKPEFNNFEHADADVGTEAVAQIAMHSEKGPKKENLESNLKKDKVDDKADKSEKKETTAKTEIAEKKKEVQNDKGNATDKNWKYSSGEGVLSEYEKTQKLREQEYKKKFTELFQDEKKKKNEVMKKNLQKQKETLKKERENRKVQQQNLVKPLKIETPKEGKDSGVLQVQTIYEEENLRDKKLRDQKEVSDLREKLKILKETNDSLRKSLAEIEEKDTEAGRLLEELTSRKAVISLGKQTFTTFGLVPSNRDSHDETNVSTADSLNLSQDFRNLDEDQFTPLEIIVNKIADQGYSLEQVYQLLDGNKDGILTLKEIRDGLDKLKLGLSSKDTEEITKALDKNTDGMISMYEFKTALQESLNIRKEYKAIMGDLDKIPNPLILEERILDLTIRKKFIETELQKAGEDLIFDEKEYNLLVSKLKKYENLAGPKETKIDAGLDNIKDSILKNKVELQDLQEIKTRTVLIQDERIEEIKGNINALDLEINKAIKQIYAEKRKLREKLDLDQIESIRKLFMEKLYSELEKVVEKNDQGVNQNVMNIIEEKEKIESTKKEKEMEQYLENYSQNGAAVKIQKNFKAKAAKQQYKAEMSKFIRARNIIITAYRRFRKRNRGAVFFGKLNSLVKSRLSFAIQSLKVLLQRKKSQNFNDGKQFEINEENYAATESLPQLNKEHPLDYYERYLLFIISKKYKGFKRLNKHNLSLDVPEVKGKCKICEKNNIQRICKKCEIGLFCQNCFTQNHGRSRNHPFLEIISYQGLSTISILASKDKGGTLKKNQVKLGSDKLPSIINDIKSNYHSEFTNLITHFKAWDPNSKGYFEIEELSLSLKRKVKNPDDVKEIINFATTNHSLPLKENTRGNRIDYISLAKVLEN